MMYVQCVQKTMMCTLHMYGCCWRACSISMEQSEEHIFSLHKGWRQACTERCVDDEAWVYSRRRIPGLERYGCAWGRICSSRVCIQDRGQAEASLKNWSCWKAQQDITDNDDKKKRMAEEIEPKYQNMIGIHLNISREKATHGSVHSTFWTLNASPQIQVSHWCRSLKLIQPQLNSNFSIFRLKIHLLKNPFSVRSLWMSRFYVIEIHMTR